MSRVSIKDIPESDIISRRSDGYSTTLNVRRFDGYEVGAESTWRGRWGFDEGKEEKTRVKSITLIFWDSKKSSELRVPIFEYVIGFANGRTQGSW